MSPQPTKALRATPVQRVRSAVTPKRQEAAPSYTQRDLMPYQRDGASWLALQRVAYLADEMGLGKTIQAIMAADFINARRVLVVCPAIARENWRREFVRWSRIGRSVQVITNLAERVWPGSELVITSYQLLQGLTKRMDRVPPFDVLICDEAHYLKTRSAKRTQHVFGPWCRGEGGLMSKTSRVWLLSGTPCPNNLGELWPALRALCPEDISVNGRPETYDAFIERYCVIRQTDYGPKIVRNKAEALPALRDTLKRFMLRRRKADVLKDLPPLRWGEVSVRAESVITLLRAAEAQPEVQAILRVLKAAEAAERLGAKDLAEEERSRALAAIGAAQATHLATLRRLTGLAKAPLVCELASEELEGGTPKLVIFAQHIDVLTQLAAGLADFNPVLIHGATSPQRRQEAIDSFQTDPQVRTFLGQLQACSTAVTLTASSSVLLAEASWVPADNIQAAARCHRIGTQESVLVRFVSLAESVDEVVTAVLRRKTAQLAQLLD